MDELFKEFPIERILSMQPGAIAGGIATIPMTLFMLATQRLSSREQSDPLPPEGITREITERTNTDDKVDKRQLLGASLFSHFGYGVAAGTIYSNTARRLPWSPIIKGSLFGVLIWAVSYLGWLPLGRFDDAATKQPASRNALMIGAHIVWGVATGLITERFEKK